MPRFRAAVVLAALALVAAVPVRAQLGDYTGHRVQGRVVTVEAGTTAQRFVVFADDVLRIDWLDAPGAEPDASPVVAQDTTGAYALAVEETADALVLTTGALRIACGKTPLRCSVEDADGRRLLAAPTDGVFRADGAARTLRYRIDPAAALYGTGERGTGLDLRGQRLRSENTQAYGYGGPLAVMNLNVPLVLASTGVALLVDNTWTGTFDLGAADPDVLAYTADGGVLSYFVLAAGDVPRLLERYTWLTGRPPMPPKWALGYLQSKYGYRDERAARAVAGTLRTKGIPADALILDLYWFDRMGDLEWNAAAFPDPAGMIADFRDIGLKTVVITEPYVVEGSRLFGPLTTTRSDYAAQDAAGRPYRLPGWWSCGCDALLVDFTRPGAQAWWWDEVAAFSDVGVAGYWTDLGEPERHPADLRHAVGPAAQVHNVYNLLWAEAMAEGWARYRPGERLFNLTRSGYAGIQRYGVTTWSGDVAATFDGLAVQLPILLNVGLSGLGYHGSDAGGFTGFRTPELYTRWLQFAALGPHARAHGVDTQPTEPWAFGAETERIVRDVLRLRYRLLPYLYTLAAEHHRTGMPLARPLFFADPADPALRDYDDAFLLGDALLVAPVVEEGARTRTVYLPRNDAGWVDYWTEAHYEGGRTVTVDAPLERIPLFVRAGAVLPLRSPQQYVDETPLDTLTWRVALPPDGTVYDRRTVYEDDGRTTAYATGAFAETTLELATVIPVAPEGAAQPPAGSLELGFGAREGQYDGMPEARVYRVAVRRLPEAPPAVVLDGTGLARQATLAALAAGGGYHYDADADVLTVQFDATLDRRQTLSVAGVGPSPTEAEAAAATALEPAYPNPFRSAATLAYRLDAPGAVRLVLRDVLGREVAVLADGWRAGGRHEVRLDARALGLAGGLYFATLTAAPAAGAAVVQTRAVTLVR